MQRFFSHKGRNLAAVTCMCIHWACTSSCLLERATLYIGPLLFAHASLNILIFGHELAKGTEHVCIELDYNVGFLQGRRCLDFNLLATNIDDQC